MSRSLALLLLLVTGLHAEPLVTGFDRFHATKPTSDSGRLLYNELGCVNCHGGDTGLPARSGPVLSGITQRINAEWIRTYLAAPSKAKPGTAMPHLFAEGDQTSIDAVVHYLGSLNPKAPFKGKSFKYLNAERGSDVYHTMGCVACHAPGKDFQPPAGTPKESDFTHRSVAYPDLAKKYSLASLTAFLTNPLATRPDGRMPRTDMDDSDYSDLAAHLLDYQHSDGTGAKPIAAFKADKALAAKGKTIIASMRCASCHELPKDVVAQPVALKSSDAGCLSSSATPGVPHYELSDAQRVALKIYLDTRDQPINAEQTVTLTLQALNCVACHDRSGEGGPDAARKAYFTGDHNLGDTGIYPPPLTDAGRKFQLEWLQNVFAGKARVRPYLQTKMPVFGTATDTLTTLLAKADAKPEKPLPAGDLAAGKKLFGVLGGIGCITCHKWGKRPSLGIQALDISTIGQRLQPGWLHDYLINPAAHRAGTLMPSFWPGGVASNQTVLGGDTGRQIASLFAFSKAANDEPEGYPALLTGEFELIPKERPIIQRTFLEGVGTHAILVGFPAGVHVAYDALHARPAILWKGQFFDAYNTWFTRAAPFEKPLGKPTAKWPTPSEATAEGVQFRGYKLDSTHVPTFLYDIGKVHVAERFEAKDGTMQRSLVWDAAALPDIAISHPDSVITTEAKGSTAGKRSFIYSWK